MITYLTIFATLLAFLVIGGYGQRKTKKNRDTLLVADHSAGRLKIAASLFTLIGAGELIVLSTLGFLFGYHGIFLFLGYFMAFLWLGLFAKKIRSIPAAQNAKSIVDFTSTQVGPKFSFVVFLCSMAAFFSLLMLQFSAIAAIIPDPSMSTRVLVITAVVLVVFTYLFVGGLGSVFRTDLFQGLLMFLLLGVVAVLLFASPDVEWVHKFETPGFNYSWGLLIAGFFVGIASADVWQRLFAAKNDSEAKRGFLTGAFALLIYGFIITSMGMFVANTAPQVDPNNVFFHALGIALPGSLSIVGTVLLLSALISTADTEIYILTTMLSEFIRKKHSNYKLFVDKKPVYAIGLVLAMVTIVAGIAAIWADNFLQIYTWLLYALISISPILWVSIFLPISDKLAFSSVIVNWLILFSMLFFRILSIETIYYYIIPCVFTSILVIVFSNIMGDVKKEIR